jgi:hypothetical protein
MDYQKIYNQIINRAQNRQLQGYKENHHIIPRCLGGVDDKENLVELTAREHFLCHKLLCFIYPKNKPLKWALYNMCRFKKYSSTREYEMGRIQLSELQSQSTLQYDLEGNFIKEWVSGKYAALELNFNQVAIAMCCNGHANTAHGFIWKRKKGEIELKINIESNQRKKHKKREPNKSGKYGIEKPVTQYDLNGNEIQQFKSQTYASKQTGIRADAIGACCLGKQKTSGGYIWKFT